MNLEEERDMSLEGGQVVLARCINNVRVEQHLTLHTLYNVVDEGDSYLVGGILFNKSRFEVVVTRRAVPPTTEGWTL